MATQVQIDHVGELQKAGYRLVQDGGAVIVISGEGEQSRARRYESPEVAYNTLILFPMMEAKRKAITEESPRPLYWTEAEAAGDIELLRCIHGEPRNVFCGKCEG